MKSNLSATSSYQDSSFLDNLKSEEFSNGPAVDQQLPAGLKIDSSAFTLDTAGDPESTTSASQNGEAGLESVKPASGNSSTTSYGEVATTGTQESRSSNNQQPETSIFDYWYYALIALILVGWLVSKALARRGPTFETEWDSPPIKRETKIIGDNPRGQFKKSERFLKPSDKVPEEEEPFENTPLAINELEETDLAEPDVLEDKSTKQRVQTMPIDQPADDDFDFDLGEEGTDSDELILDEEINNAVDSSKSGASSKRFKTEDDDDVSLANDFEIDDDEFDDQDSQLSLADSDTDFGFDLDDEEPDSLLGSGNQATEALAENVESAGEGLGDLGLADVVDDAKNAVSGVAEQAQAGIAGAAVAAGTAAAGVAAAGAAAKGGFFARLFGSKNKKTNDNEEVDSPLHESEVAAVELSGDDVADMNPIESLGGDEDSDFDFDLEADDDGSVSALPLATNSDDDEGFDLELDTDDSDEFSFDLEDSDEDISVSSMETLVDEPVIEGLPVVEEEVAQVEEVAVGFDSDSDEFSFDLEDSDEEVSVSSMETLVDEPVIEGLPVVEEEVAQVEEVGGSEGNDSREFAFGLFDDDVSDKESVEVASESSDEDESSITAPVVAAAFGAGLAGIGLAGTGSADTAESDRQWEAKLNVLEDQNAKLNSQVTTLKKQLEEANKSGDLSKSLQQEHETLTESVKSLGLEKDELLKEKELAEKEKSRLTEELEAAQKHDSTWEQEKADLLKEQEELKAEKELAEKEKSRLTEELEATQKHDSTWEQEKADLLKEQEELKAEKELAEEEKSRLTEELEAAQKHDSTWEQEKADLLKEQEELKAEKELAEEEKSRLTEELEAAEKQNSTWEQEKADLLKEQEELKAEKEAGDQSADELSALQAEVDAFAQERTEFESEIQTLQTKLADVEAKPAENGSSEDIESLRDRFKRRLAAEHRKRKEAEQLVEQAEDQRNEVAKLLRAAKAELKELNA